jgi:hypothetical protein
VSLPRQIVLLAFFLLGVFLSPVYLAASSTRPPDIAQLP